MMEKSKEIIPAADLIKITAGNDHHLSDMADNKAQIVITVNSIILSAIVSLGFGRLKDTRKFYMTLCQSPCY
jgi:hypothetical protein